MEKIKEKLISIFEENKFSPAFTVAAENEMEKENFEKAVGILKNGLKIYPEYPTAHILLGKVYLKLKEFKNSENEFQKAAKLLGSKETLNFYISQLEIQKKKYQSEENFEDKVESFPEENLENELPEFIEELENQEDEIPDSIDNKLDELAKEISTAKINLEEKEESISKIKDDFIQTPKDAGIVTETLAKIYISQGKFKEALEVYEKLLEKFPAQKDYLQPKITEIKEQLSGLDW